MIILDCSLPIQLKPGFVVSPLKNKRSYRVWWLFFAITFCNMRDSDYYDYVAGGNTYWKKPNEGN